MFSDTIAAIATPWGEGGVAILRISGPEAFGLARQLCRFQGELTPRRAKNAQLIDLSGESIDHCLLLPFAQPASFTGEDVVEVHLHGGSLLANRALELALSAGARMALPGEFTRRAYERGKIDLSQAEAVTALIKAKSVEALKAADRALAGQLKTELSDLSQEVIDLSAQIEVGLDFPDEDVPYLDDSDLQGRLQALRLQLADLRDRMKAGMTLREGVKVALLGRPNAGKSSLLNCLLKESRSIVTNIPGTTRDVIEAVLTHRGVPLRLLDTAGMGEVAHDEVEALGIERSRKAMEEADVRLWLVDGTRHLTAQDRELIDEVTHKPHLLVITKADLPQVVTPEQLSHWYSQSPVVRVSSAQEQGIEELKETITGQIYGSTSLGEGLNASAHQIELLRQADELLAQAALALEDNLGQSTVAICLEGVRANFDAMVGIGSTEDLLHQIFSQFCIGK